MALPTDKDAREYSKFIERPDGQVAIAMDSEGSAEHGAADSGSPVKMGAKAVDSLPSAVDADDRVNLIATLYGMLITAGYTFSSESNRDEEINPLSDQYSEEELVDTTDLSATTRYYPSSSGMTMAGYKDLSIEFVISGGVTMTVEVTNDDASSPDWIDITKAGYELNTNTTGNASFVDTSGVLDFDNLNKKKVRIKSVTADATNGVQYHARRKAL